MKTALLVLVSCLVVTSCLGQSTSAKWQVATVMAAKAHPPGPSEEPSLVRYDVTLRVGNTEYVVLYTPPDGTLRDIVQYRLGENGLVLIGADTIKYNDLLGRTREVPILLRRTLPAKTER